MYAKQKRIKMGIPKSRKARAVNIATFSMPMSKVGSNKGQKHAIFHTSLSGSVLMLLNHLKQPVRAWTDVAGFMPHEATLVDKTRFTKILRSLNPATLYCNNGKPIEPIDGYNVVMYTDKSLDTLLKEIEEKPIESSVNDGTSEGIPSFEFMKSMDEKMTRKEYEAFCEQYRRNKA